MIIVALTCKFRGDWILITIGLLILIAADSSSASLSVLTVTLGAISLRQFGSLTGAVSLGKTIAVALVSFASLLQVTSLSTPDQQPDAASQSSHLADLQVLVDSPELLNGRLAIWVRYVEEISQSVNAWQWATTLPASGGAAASDSSLPAFGHNLILDLAVRSGLVTAIAAAFLVVGLLIVTWWKPARRAALLFSLSALAIFLMGTFNNFLQPPSWTLSSAYLLATWAGALSIRTTRHQRPSVTSE